MGKTTMTIELDTRQINHLPQHKTVISDYRRGKNRGLGHKRSQNFYGAPSRGSGEALGLRRTWFIRGIYVVPRYR